MNIIDSKEVADEVGVNSNTELYIENTIESDVIGDDRAHELQQMFQSVLYIDDSDDLEEYD